MSSSPISYRSVLPSPFNEASNVGGLYNIRNINDKIKKFRDRLDTSLKDVFHSSYVDPSLLAKQKTKQEHIAVGGLALIDVGFVGALVSTAVMLPLAAVVPLYLMGVAVMGLGVYLVYSTLNNERFVADIMNNNACLNQEDEDVIRYQQDVELLQYMRMDLNNSLLKNVDNKIRQKICKFIDLDCDMSAFSTEEIMAINNAPWSVLLPVPR